MGIGPEGNTGKIRRRRPRRIGQVAYSPGVRELSGRASDGRTGAGGDGP